MPGMGGDSERLRVLRVSCGCGSETAVLLGDPEHFADELLVAKAAVGTSRPWTEEPEGVLRCGTCEQVIEITRKPRGHGQR